MCNYCGCREFPLIAQLTEEHEEIESVAAALGHAITDGRLADAAQLLDRLVELLTPHTALEEDGLFAAVRAEGSLAAGVDRLCVEHSDIHGVLGSVNRAAPDWSSVSTALTRLRRHIENEEQGLFPAAVIALSIAEWDRITPAGYAVR